MSAPVVSVVIAAYNGAALIGETLASLSAQTLADWEAIVVDDGSTDATRDVVAAWPDPRVRLVALPANGGPVHARNRGLAEARGRYVAALDQDDLCLPERLARQVAWLDAHPRAVLLGSAAGILRGGTVRAARHPAVTSPALLGFLLAIENPLVWSSVTVRGAAARALDPFNRPDRLYAEDFDLYHRLSRIGSLARLDEPLLLYRDHEGGISKRHVATMRASAAAVLAEAHRDQFGARAAAVAALLVAHVMGGDPVPDRATLAALGHALAAIERRYLASRAPDADDRALIRHETARRWRRIARAGLRAGTLTLVDVLATRPAPLGLGGAGPGTLLVGAAVGGARRLAR